jgi:hypothetical protein
LQLAKQILRNESATPGGGECGEMYRSESRFQVKAPYMFFVVQIQATTRLYPASQLVWATKFQLTLEKIVEKMWASHQEPMKQEVKDFCLYRIGVGQVSLSWYKLSRATKPHFQETPTLFEIEDVITTLERLNITNHNDEEQMQRARDCAEAHFQEQTEWLLLTLLLNLRWNLVRSFKIPESFKGLLENSHCLIY